jgi:hypothetical protein
MHCFLRSSAAYSAAHACEKGRPNLARCQALIVLSVVVSEADAKCIFDGRQLASVHNDTKRAR